MTREEKEILIEILKLTRTQTEELKGIRKELKKLSEPKDSKETNSEPKEFKLGSGRTDEQVIAHFKKLNERSAKLEENVRKLDEGTYDFDTDQTVYPVYDDDE